MKFGTLLANFVGLALMSQAAAREKCGSSDPEPEARRRGPAHHGVRARRRGHEERRVRHGRDDHRSDEGPKRDICTPRDPVHRGRRLTQRQRLVDDPGPHPRQGPGAAAPRVRRPQPVPGQGPHDQRRVGDGAVQLPRLGPGGGRASTGPRGSYGTGASSAPGRCPGGPGCRGSRATTRGRLRRTRWDTGWGCFTSLTGSTAPGRGTSSTTRLPPASLPSGVRCGRTHALTSLGWILFITIWTMLAMIASPSSRLCRRSACTGPSIPSGGASRVCIRGQYVWV